MLSAVQEELFSCLGRFGFVRISRTDDALFTSDVPRRVDKACLRPIENDLTERGFTFALSSHGLWQVSLSSERLRALFPPCTVALTGSLPDRKENFTLYELARLLNRHPAPWDAQPKPLLYCIIKRADHPGQMNEVASILLEACAIRLRKGQPLPSEAAGLLFSLAINP